MSSKHILVMKLDKARNDRKAKEENNLSDIEDLNNVENDIENMKSFLKLLKDLKSKIIEVSDKFLK